MQPQTREYLRYGYRLALHCTEKKGFVVGTTSGIAPVGVAEDSEEEPLLNFEQAVFTIVPGDRDLDHSRHDGEPVKFGSVVRLIHQKQRKPVAYNMKLHSVVDPANHRVTLEGTDSPERWDKWRIMPRYKVRGEGERVTEGDHIVLQVSSGDKLFLGVAKRKDDSVDGCYEVHAGSVAAGFAVSIYDSDASKQTSRAGRPLLRAGDCVVLYHKEKHSYAYVGPDGRYTLNPIPEKDKTAAAATGASANISSGSMFLIENRDRYRGGVVHGGREQCVRLKDLRTGKHMTCVWDDASSGAPAGRSHSQQHLIGSGGGEGAAKPVAFRLTLPETSEFDDAATLFALHAVGEDQNAPLADRSKVFLECPFFDDEGVWAHEGEPIANRRVGLRDGFRMEKLHSERNARGTEQRHMLRGLPHLSHSDGFELQRVDDNVFQKLNIILSFLPPISALAESMDGFTLPEYSRVIQVQENLLQLKAMVLVRSTPNSAPKPDEASQRQLHDQGVSQMCLGLAQKILESPRIDVDSLRTTDPIVAPDAGVSAASSMGDSAGGGAIPSSSSGTLKYSDIFELLQQLFSLVQLVVRGIPAHALAIEDSMEFIVESVLCIPAALDCYLDCIEGNKELVDASETKITGFFCKQLLRRSRFTGALQALTHLVACGDEGIRQQQEAAMTILLVDRKEAEKHFAKIVASNGSVQIAIPNYYFEESVKRVDPLAETVDDPHTGTTWVNLSRLEELLTAKHLPRIPHFVEFFVAQMRFFASLCTGKNSRGVAASMSVVSLEAVLPVILSENVPPKMRAAFISFFTEAVLFCDGSLDIRETCRSLHYVVRQPQPLQLETDLSPMFEQVKEFALRNLSDLASCDFQARPQVLMMADAVVSLCHGLLCRGMFTMGEYPGLVRLLVAIVDSRDDAAKLGLTTSRVPNRVQHAQQQATFELQDRLVSVQIEITSIMDTLVTFLLAKHAMETVDRFCHGQRLPRLSQLLDLDPESSFLAVAERYHSNKGKFSFFDDGAANPSFEVLATLLSTCMDAGQHRNLHLRTMAVRLFCRLTNWPRELLRVIQSIQLLTNRSAAQYYREAKAYADELGKLSRMILTDKVLVAAKQVLDAIETLIASPTGGTQLDKIGMLRHLLVPNSVVAFLHGIGAPVRTEATMQFAIQAVGFLRVSCQDTAVADYVVSEIDMVRHLITADCDLLSLIRCVFIDRPENVVLLSSPVINEIVACLAHPHSAVESILLLQDVVRTKDEFSRYISAVQDAVWRGLCGTYAAHSVVRIKLRWTGRAGRAMRRELLQGSEYFNDMGFLRLHLEMARLIFYITKFNKLTRTEEVRHEVFGATAIEDIMEVVSNDELPAMFRAPYINLLQTLVIQDHAGSAGFITHRCFPAFVARCLDDIRALRITLGDSVKYRGEGPVVAQPTNDFEVEMENARNSPELLVNQVLMSIVPCLRHAMADIDQLQNARVSDQFITDIMEGLNSVVDELCELVRFTCCANTFSDFPEFAAAYLGRSKLYKMLTVARKTGICGTDLWSSSIDEIIAAILPTDKPPVAARTIVRKPSEDEAHAAALVDGESQLPGRMSDAEDDDDEEGEDLSETQRWVAYYTQHVAKCPALAPHNEFASAAGAIIRAGVLGTRFLRHTSASLLDLPEALVPPVLKILRQVVALTEPGSYDDSGLLDAQCMRITGEALPNELSFAEGQSMEERQNVIASWASSSSGKRATLLPAVLQIMSTSRNSEIVTNATATGIQLTEGGNRQVQRTLNDALRQRPDEELFTYLRGCFASFRDSLRIYFRLSKAGSGAHLSDVESTRMLLRLVQLLCEGHYEDLQDYMRAQDDNQVSVNVLESLVTLLDTLMQQITPRTHAMLIQLLATIAELIQGPCRGNQEAFINLGIGDALAALISLSNDEAKDLSKKQLDEVHDGAVVVLLSLLEGRSDAPQLSPLVGSMSLTLLIEAMDRSYDEYEDAHDDLLNLVESVDPKKELVDELAVGVQVFIFFKTCLDMQLLYSSADEFEFTDCDGLTLKQALRESHSYKFLNRRVAMIEIARGANVERVYFRIPSVSHQNLREDSKEQLIKRVNRENDTTRLLDFFERCAKLILELEYYENMRSTPGLSTVHAYSGKLDVLSLLFAVIINGILISTVAAPNTLGGDLQANEWEIATRVFGIAQMVLQSILFLHFFFGPMRVHLDAKWLRWQDHENEAAAQASRENLSIDPPEVSYTRIDQLPMPLYIGQSLLWLLRYGLFWQRVLMLVAAFAGFYQSPIWYSIQLLQVVQMSPQLFNVVLAVTQNGAALLLTLALQLVVIYIFSIIAFYSYAEYLTDEGENFSCHSLLNCVLVMTNVGLRMGGGIADELPYASYHNAERGAGRFFFDILFFLIIIIIFLNIVFGIIVDTFAELREQRQFIEEDQTTKCFICGIADNDFDRVVSGGFEHHIRYEHNMWHYLFFMHYVQIKRVEDLNGAEHYVREMMRLNEPGFFPIGKALLLEKSAQARKKQEEDNRGDDPVAKEVAALHAQMAVMASQLAKMVKSVDAMAASAGSPTNDWGAMTTTSPTVAAALKQKPPKHRDAAGSGSASTSAFPH